MTVTTPIASHLEDILAADFASWNVPAGGCALVTSDGILASTGDLDTELPWASVTKVVSALAVLDVVAQGDLDLDEPAGPQGSTVRHLLAHASGLAFNEPRVVSAPGRRRIYSNVGIDTVTQVAVERAGAASAAALVDARVLQPLGMTRTRLVGPPAHGAVGPLADLALLARELVNPRVLDVVHASTLTYPDLAGVLPGYGRQDPNGWGLGVEIRGRKSPHWMPSSSSPRTFGHFGRSGSFVWVDPDADLAGIALTGRPFGDWAADAWSASTTRWHRAVTAQESGER